MLMTGLTLAVFTTGGFYIVYRKLPHRVQKFLCKHSLFTDVSTCFLVYMLFGGTIVGLFAGAFCGIMVSIMLALVNNPDTNKFIEKIYKKSGEIWIDLTKKVGEVAEEGAEGAVEVIY